MSKPNFMFEPLKVRDHKTGQKLLKDPESGTLYEKVESGFSWPTETSAYICVVAQKFKTGELDTLYESRHDNIVDLGKELFVLKKIFSLDNFIGDCENENRIFEDMLSDVRDSLIQNYKEDYFYVCQSRLPKNFHVAVQLLRVNLKLNKLTIPANGILQQRLRELQQADPSEENLEKRFPEVLTLASVIFEFPSQNEIEEKHKPKDAWAVDDEFHGRGSFMGM